jgi:hypothetical protein
LQEPVVRLTDKPTIPFEQLKLKSQFSLTEAKQGAAAGNGLVKEIEPTITTETVVFTNKPFTLEDIKIAINKYAAEQFQLGNKFLHSTLTTSKIDLIGETEISLTLINASQAEKLQTVKQDFLDEIRKIIQNNTVTLGIKLSEAQVTVKAFKPSDKFKQLAEKYPALLELKKRFDLEIDY